MESRRFLLRVWLCVAAARLVVDVAGPLCVRVGGVVQLLLPIGGGPWFPARDGDASVRAVFDRHYSRRRYRDGRSPALFVGPGEKMVLRTADCSAIFVWRKFISMDAQQGVNCAVFRNEGTERSSALIREAMRLAWARWPRERLYTYVDGRRVRSSNPGYCFKCAGWRKVGVTKGGLTILAVE